MAMSSHGNTDLHQTLVDAFLDVTQEERQQSERLTAKRRLKARRAIEDYFERKRLERQIADGWWLE
ncbi:hypothetical protein AAIA72_09065 [Hahella sp. SMD15-11]|uniref:Uncharacterized protein n=1 Tax=Thermohahella caldifontis TaxID=3142973 RepID=A0AB39URM4_9GAMM